MVLLSSSFHLTSFSVSLNIFETMTIFFFLEELLKDRLILKATDLKELQLQCSQRRAEEERR